MLTAPDLCFDCVPVTQCTAFLYVHESSPLASHVLLTREADSPDLTVDVNGTLFEGFSGVLRKVECGSLTIGTVIQAPRYPRGAFQDVESNKALNAIFEMPPRLKHSSVLLPGESSLQGFLSIP